MKLSTIDLQSLMEGARQIGEQQVTVALPDGTTAEIHFRPRPQNRLEAFFQRLRRTTPNPTNN